MLTGQAKEAIKDRLSRVSGQVEGVANMVDNDRYCVDVLHQIRAVEAALHKVAEIILRNHLQTCVASSFESADDEDRKQKIEEILQLFGRLHVR